ncbi:bromodomain adjacent to zinc finger domain protein 2B isoform X5 [Pipra filicauda]|uniref:Bromodomain adjacent to zinc finger domain protein 2B n=1 Tax=Pipra filicauda TaxID=649802 RepID=A0A6J2HRG4_9PASS|nr:bromodomain adjacent to zinc finger domain protein 2B isoform X5 [Pipra filicauda]XP_027590345.1 bromodomain adjacent to zinc finger domain protein 2B isoform X5 [Pipra filicauda]XP_039236402.1 bromodomain adjacent to zinc finger domain protein 2B isoform X5 [Pipra filicauda]XP_039236403.1 bromodomain adjacent to zinc finger domain protein 2B isoform X5 [Pipra filicauda]XP_039236408.1 bromodomain adjacent to zinc finger domain protein 2B isoform X5 [Pipra filicauda]XP_039236409.1 bromodomai
MESGERLTSPSASSAAAASTPASSTPSGASEGSKGGLSTGAATLSSTISTCEWWRTADTHSRPGAAFFPPLLGIPPLFAPAAQNHDPASFHSRTTGKSSRSSTDKGVNGSLNGSSTTAVSAVSTSVLSTSIATSAGQGKAVTSGAGGRKYNQEQSKVQLLDTRADKIKDKKPRKKAMESSSNSDSDSGSSSDTSSEGISSSDSDDLEEDEEEEEDQSAEESEDDESDSENEAHHKSKNKVLMHSDVTDTKTDGQKPHEKSQEKRTHQQIPLVSDSQTHSSFQSQQKQPQVLSQQLPFIFQSSQAKEESVNKHTSVIQSTGLVPNVKPLSLVHQAKKETYLKLIVPSPDLLKAGNKNTSEESLSLTSDVRSKREQYKQTFPAAQLKKQESSKNLKKVIAALSSPKSTSSSPAHQKLSSLENNHSNPFLTNALLGNHQPNGVIQSVIQEAPLALTTKPKPQTKSNESVAISSSAPFSLPVNLSACGKKPAGNRTPVMPSTSPVLPGSGKDKPVSNNAVNAVKPQHRLHSAKLVVEQFRGVDSDAPSSKDSDDSNDDDDDDEDEDEDDEDDDSDDSQSESDSNSESDTEGSEEEDDEDDKDQDESDTDTEGEKTPLKLNKTSSSVKSSSIGLAAHSTPLNLQVAKSPSSAPAALCPESQPAVFLGTAPAALPPSAHCGISKRRRVADERELRVPLEYGWQRETRIRNFGGRLQGEVAYFAPCGKKLRQYPEVVKYLSRNGIMDISRDNFSFSAKIGVGDFYEARDGPQGVQWCLLKEEEVIPRIRAMEGRRGRPPNPDRQHSREESRTRRRKGRPPNVGSTEFLDNADAKLLRKLQAQEIARQAAQIKLLRKLQKQEQARAAKEAKKQQAIMAAEEKRKQKEQIKIMKQQEKIKRIQQIRMEKELRAQQILEAKKKKKEEAANAKLLEAEKRIKEKEMRRQQAVLLKHQELERHRLDMVWERERRRQHMMLMKAMEARKKAEEKERLKQEKRDEKRLNKERKLEQRRLELEMAKELKKPNEDMCLADQKPFPELPRIPGLVLDGSTFSDCLMVVQFLRNFGKVLGFDVSVDVPSLSVLQEGLLNIGDSMGEVQDLVVKLVSAAVCDPGLGTGYKAKTILGEHLLSVGINRDNVSEILQIFMEAHCGQTELTESLKTKAFQAHTPAQKASVLAFLVNELACSKSVVSEIDKNIDYMSNLRRDKWMVEGKLRKLRIIHAKKTGKREAAGGGEGGEEPHSLEPPQPGRKRRRKGDSDDDDDDEEDSEDQADEEDEDEEDKDEKKGKKADVCEDEDDGDQTASVEELEKQIEKLTKQQSQYRKKLFEASHCLRSMMFGQDRYRRRYWILPQCGGIFVEGMESGEGLEEIAKEKEKLKKEESMHIKEEFETEEKLHCLAATHCEQKEDLKEKDSTNLFLQKPGSFSKLSKLLEVAKMPPESDIMSPKPNGSAANGCTLSYPSNSKPSLCSLQPSVSQSSMEKSDSTNLFSPNASGTGKFYSSALIPSDQLLKTLTEKSRQWFSLLPRVPCDDTSVTQVDTAAPAAPLTPQSQPPSKSPSPVPSPLLGSTSAQSPMGLSPFALSPLQQMKTGLPIMGLQFCGWPTGVLTSNVPFPSPLPALGSGLGLSEVNGNSFLASSVPASKSESPAVQTEKIASAPPTAAEVAKPVDYPNPKPIPEEMQYGWWRITDPEDLKSLLKVLHLRGIREKALQKQIQKHMDYITLACIKNKDVAIIDTNENEDNQVTRDVVENWSVEEQAMEMDLTILQQVEDLERRVASASLQVKGWLCPEPASERDDLVYRDHKSITRLHKKHDGDCAGGGEGSASSVERRSDNPLDIAVTRLADLERNIERRYLKSPLSTTIQIKLDNVGTVTVPAPAPSISGDGDGTEEDIAPGLRVWRRALSEARSAAQVALCIQQLQKSIAWEKSIMKVYCQICRKGDNEELLLLCDGCDKGCHTYCHRPKISTIPDGDWFCPACIAKASGQTLKIKKLQIKGKKSNEQKRSRKLAGETEDEDSATTSASLKKGKTDPKKRKMDENVSVSQLKQENCTAVKKPKRDDSKDLAVCSMILSELETHEDAWPFLLPVNLKLVPGYKKVIKKPMDFSTIRDKLSSGQYPNLEAFSLDVRLVFDNCETFNEDDSDIGRAGHNMRKYFEKKWTEIFKVS